MSDPCIIVGAGTGISLAVARRFGKAGSPIALIARRQDALNNLVNLLSAEGIRAIGTVADASDPATLTAKIESVVEQLGQPGILVYNAHAATRKPPSTLLPAELVHDLQICVVGALAAVQAVIPLMRTRKRGTILLTGGGYALEPLPAVASIGIGKAAIRNLAFSLAKELAPDNIHVATVTVGGLVKPGTAFDPALIAEEYWKLHVQAPGSFERETIFSPEVT
jgi:NADP-dependent 3-hydroxy acid dehydrogenase YdfG